MIELHGFSMSPNTKRARFGLEEAGLEYTFHEVDLMKGEQKQPPYLALNPTARVPALKDGSFALWESNAILEYVAALAPEKKLAGESVKERATISKWMFMGAAHLSPNIARIFAHTIRLPEEKRIPQIVAEARSEVDRCLGPMNEVIALHGFLAGARFTNADISLVPPLAHADMLQIDLGKFPHVQTWVTEATARPTWKKI